MRSGRWSESGVVAKRYVRKKKKNESPARCMLHVSERQKLHACMRAPLRHTGLRFKNSLSPTQEETRRNDDVSLIASAILREPRS